MPKLSEAVEHRVLDKLKGQGRILASWYAKDGEHKAFYSRKVGYFLQVLDFEPRVLDGKGRRRPPSEFKELRFAREDQAKCALCCLNSNLFYWLVTVFSGMQPSPKRWRVLALRSHGLSTAWIRPPGEADWFRAAAARQRREIGQIVRPGRFKTQPTQRRQMSDAPVRWSRTPLVSNRARVQWRPLGLGDRDSLGHLANPCSCTDPPPAISTAGSSAYCGGSSKERDVAKDPAKRRHSLQSR